MVRLLAPLLAGILAAIALDSTRLLWIPALVIGSILPFWLVSIRKARYRTRWIFGLLVYLLLFLAGFNLVILRKEILLKSHFSGFKSSEILAVVIDPPREKEHSWKTVLEVIAVKQKNEFVPARGKLLAYLAKDSSLRLPVYGNTLIIRAMPSDVSPPANPGMFNYRQYLARNNIYQQVYLKTGSWKITGAKPSFSVRALAFRLRQHFLEMLHQNRLDGQEYAVAAALILGQDEILDYETRHEFASAGVMHILGISGLHVGILYMVLNLIFGFLDRNSRGRILKVLLVLILIWFYALITGLSPAALRSAAMFSFVSFGNLMKRNIHIMNTLAVSAFVLLLYDPMLVTNIGFQFSYIAVAGIVLLHKELYELWSPRFWLTDQVWSLVAMSLVAQFVTFPISLYYFHQFPVYFLAANLLAIPLSNAAIYTGMAVIASSFLPPLSRIIGLITSWLLKALNISMGWIESLPHSVIPDIPLSLPESLLLYLAIISVSAYILHRRKPLVMITLVALLGMFTSQALRSYRHQKQQKFLVYCIDKHSAFSLVSGSKCLLLADSLLLQDRKLIDFNITAGRSLLGLDQTATACLEKPEDGKTGKQPAGFPVRMNGSFLQSGHKRIALIDSLPKSQNTQKPLKVDFLVLYGNPRLSIARLCRYYDSGIIIFDASDSWSKSERWAAECRKSGKKYWDVRKSGAFVVDI